MARSLIIYACGSIAKLDLFLGAKAKWIFSLLLTQHWSQDWCDICVGSREIWQKYGSPWQPWQLLTAPGDCSSRNWQWKILAPAETTFQFESAGHFTTLPLSFPLSVVLTCTLDMAAMTVSARNISPAAYFGFWVNLLRLRLPDCHGCQGMADILARHLSSKLQL